MQEVFDRSMVTPSPTCSEVVAKMVERGGMVELAAAMVNPRISPGCHVEERSWCWQG